MDHQTHEQTTGTQEEGTQGVILGVAIGVWIIGVNLEVTKGGIQDLIPEGKVTLGVEVGIDRPHMITRAPHESMASPNIINNSTDLTMTTGTLVTPEVGGQEVTTRGTGERMVVRSPQQSGLDRNNLVTVV